MLRIQRMDLNSSQAQVRVELVHQPILSRFRKSCSRYVVLRIPPTAPVLELKDTDYVADCLGYHSFQQQSGLACRRLTTLRPQHRRQYRVQPTWRLCIWLERRLTTTCYGWWSLHWRFVRWLEGVGDGCREGVQGAKTVS